MRSPPYHDRNIQPLQGKLARKMSDMCFDPAFGRLNVAQPHHENINLHVTSNVDGTGKAREWKSSSKAWFVDSNQGLKTQLAFDVFWERRLYRSYVDEYAYRLYLSGEDGCSPAATFP